MKKYIIIFILIFSQVPSLAWHDQTTHPSITNYTVEKYFPEDFLKKILISDDLQPVAASAPGASRPWLPRSLISGVWSAGRSDG